MLLKVKGLNKTSGKLYTVVSYLFVGLLILFYNFNCETFGKEGQGGSGDLTRGPGNLPLQGSVAGLGHYPPCPFLNNDT